MDVFVVAFNVKLYFRTIFNTTMARLGHEHETVFNNKNENKVRFKILHNKIIIIIFSQTINIKKKTQWKKSSKKRKSKRSVRKEEENIRSLI